MRKTVPQVVVAALTLVLATSCSNGTELPAPPSDAPFAHYTTDESGGMDALLAGKLALSDGCFVIEGESGPRLPVFPAGQVAWDGEVLTFNESQPDGSVAQSKAAIGDEVTIVGGEVSSVASDMTVPEACAAGVTLFRVAAS